MDESMSRSTITRTLTKLKQTGTVNTKYPTGRPMNKNNLDAIQRATKMIRNNPCISNRKGAAKMKIATTTYRRIINKKLGLKSFKKQVVPK